jgi:hypothetical protein
VHPAFSAADVKRIFENNFLEIVKRVSKIYNLLNLAPKKIMK